MKGIQVLFIAVMAAVVAISVPIATQKAYAADIGYIERLVPAESQEVETGGGEVAWVLLAPFDRGYDTERIERLLPAESAEVEIAGGGETPPMALAPFERGHDTGKIERLLPAESAE